MRPALVSLFSVGSSDAEMRPPWGRAQAPYSPQLRPVTQKRGGHHDPRAYENHDRRLRPDSSGHSGAVRTNPKDPTKPSGLAHRPISGDGQLAAAAPRYPPFT